MTALLEPSLVSTAPFRGWSTWYRVTGDLNLPKPPLVVLHGGPGATHNYTLRIAEVALSGRAVIHYDQLGCGNSTHLPDEAPSFWTPELFLEELDNLLDHLGIAESYHLLGQSWGGMLGAEHAIRQPSGLRSLVISNSPASMELWVQEATRLRALMPEEVRGALDHHEAAGTLDDPAYLEATEAFYDRHVCRIKPLPNEVQESFEQLATNSTVYAAMNGPNEFFCIGSLRTWSVVDQVAGIAAPTLLLSGRFDEATPATIQPFFDNIGDVRWEIFEQSSHMPFVEEPEAYMKVVNAFLDEHDQ